MIHTHCNSPVSTRPRGLARARAALRGALAMLVLAALAATVGAAPASPSVISLGSLNGPNGFRIDGRSPGDRAGRTVGNAGDVNGDGLDDLIIGVSAAAPDGQQGAGEVYVVFGSTANPAALPLAALNGANGFRLVGATFNDAAGESVSGAGDVNGDGYADVIIGAPGADPGGIFEAGAAYIVFGAPSFPARVNLADLNGDNGFRLNGIAEDDGAGVSVGGAGDMNGDGLDDLLVGAPNATVSGKAAAGQTYVVFGDHDFPPQINLASLNGGNGLVLNGISADSYAANDLGGAGDMNGDGYDDAFVAAWKTSKGADSEAGAVYVLFGKASFPAKLSLGDLTGATGFRLDGAAEGDRAGQAVDSAGDVNGDGRGDLVIGAPFAASQRGMAYVVFGASVLPPTLSLGALSGANGFQLSTSVANAEAGMAVGAADINGDGLDDVLVGAPAAGEGSQRFAGRSYVAFGRASFPAEIDLDALTPVTGMALDGEAAGDHAGQALSAAGDRDGDGYDEIAIGAPGGGIGPEGDMGYTYVVQGGGTLGVPLPVTHPGTAENDTLTGSGGNDVMLGGRGADQLTAAAGEDVLKGGAGRDLLLGGAGADYLIGGSGVDVASYAGSAGGVTVNLFTGAASGGDAAGDRFRAVEGIIGSPLADTLTGDAHANVLAGGGEDDNLRGGGGNDAFGYAPQSGRDTVADFAPGPGSDDYLDFTSYPAITGPAALIVALNGSDTLITLPGGETIRLLGIAPGRLHGDDYRFAGAPLARPDEYATPINQPLTIGAPGVLGNDDNAGPTPLSAVLVSGPSHGTLTLNANGSFTYTPAANYTGGDAFAYRASNGQNSNVAEVSLTVTLLPPSAVNDSYTVKLNKTLSVPAPGVLGNDQTPGGPQLSAQLVDEPVHGTLNLNANGSFSYTPTVDFGVQDSFSYVASNGLSSNVATVTIHVLDPDGPPVAADDNYTAQVGKSLTIGAPGVLANDVNPLPDTMTAQLVTATSHGALALQPSGAFTYTPQANYSGQDTFTYRASNGQPSNVATVTITVSSSGYRIQLPAVLGE